jgi:AraC family transcriptional regulator
MLVPLLRGDDPRPGCCYNATMHRDAHISPAKEPLRRAMAGGFRLELLPRGPYEAAYMPQYGTIGFAFERQSGVHAFASDRRTPFRTRPNSLAFVPANCDVYSHSVEGGEYLTLTDLAEPAPSPPQERRFNDIMDLPALRTAENLRRLLLTGASGNDLLLEYHACTLQERVAHIFGIPTEQRASGWMTPRRLRQIDELIEAEMDGPLTVRDLADRLGLSAGFFARAFKAATGKPPHAYIIDRRISRARALLRSAPSDLSRIAYACGFSSHAHMTSAFRVRLGVTPARLRGANHARAAGHAEDRDPSGGPATRWR